MNSTHLFRTVSFWSVLVFTACASAQADHLLLSEIGVDPVHETDVAVSQYIEIFNPTTAPISLNNYYLTDSNLYTSITMTSQVDTGTSDNLFQFPAGHTLEPGQVAVITHNGEEFLAQSFKGDITYYAGLPGSPLLFEVADSRNDIPDMFSKNTSQSTESERLNFELAFAGEFVVMFHWDGLTPRVQDVDIVAWRFPDVEDRFAPKDGSITGSDGSSYMIDNGNHGTLFVPGQRLILTRLTTTEAFEDLSGGNGITGHDESTERGSNWTVEVSTPKSPGLTNLVAVNGNKRPAIFPLSRSVENPGSADAVELGATVTDADGSVAEVAFYVNSGNGFVRHSATFTSGNDFKVSVGPFTEGTIVKYYIEAIDNEEAVTWLSQYGEMAFETFIIDSNPVLQGEVIINEILYGHVGPDVYEFVELYNKRATPVRLSYFTFLNTILENFTLPEDAEIPGNGYLVLTKNPVALQEQFDIPAGVQVHDWGRFPLIAPDRLRLIHTNSMDFGRLSSELDIVYYTSQSPWPVYDTAAGNRSIELKSPLLYNGNGSNWAVSVEDATPGKPNSVMSGVGDWTLY